MNGRFANSAETKKLIKNESTVLKSTVQHCGWNYDCSTLPHKINNLAAGITITQPFCTISIPQNWYTVKVFLKVLFVTISKDLFYNVLRQLYTSGRMELHKCNSPRIICRRKEGGSLLCKHIILANLRLWRRFNFIRYSKKDIHLMVYAQIPWENLPCLTRLPTRKRHVNVANSAPQHCVCVAERLRKVTKKGIHLMVYAFFGDPWENRTPVTAVKGRCLSRLTNGPLVAGIGLEPMTYRV